MQIQTRSIEDITGTIFNIQGYSIHDGPGIRTVVFTKGCALRCHWCSNPESQNFGPEVEFLESKCISCGRCLSSCPRDAINAELKVRSGFKMDKSRCDECGECAHRCPSGALRRIGEEMTVREVMSRIRRDAPYYRKSGGGVTLSGGEPLAQPGFCAAILKECYDSNIHAALETAGHVPWRHFEEVLPFTDLVLYDIKHMDDGRHTALTGVSNHSILANARRLAQSGVEMIVRMPLIPDYNSSRTDLIAIAEYVTGLGIREIHLLPFHQLGKDKYKRLCREYAMGDGQSPTASGASDRDRTLCAVETLEDHGLRVQIGG